jgi:DHA1 family bicyclomycin/chloramphenicol resistance-like MFS transporter
VNDLRPPAPSPEAAAATRATAEPRRTWAFAALLASLSMIAPFAIDAYLPAFPAIALEFGAAPLAVQQTLSAYLAAYAIMMLWHGALSDALGRRPVVLGGLVVYAFATLGCAIAGNIESLWLFRVLQGLSAGTGLVVGRAIVRDRFQGPEAQRLMSQMTLVFGIAPAVAPVLGGVMLNVFGWRAIFWMLLVLVAAVFVWAVLRLPETLPRAARQPLHPAALWRNYRTVLRTLDFALLAAMLALNFAGFFIYIAGAPAFLIDLLGVTTWGFAWLFVPMIGGIMLGAILSGRFAGRRSPQRTVRAGYALIFAGVVLNLLTCWALPPGVVWNVLPIFVFCIGSALVMPSATLLMLDLFPTMRGMASSLQGFVHFALSAVVAGTIAPLLVGSVAARARGLAGAAVASFTLWLVYQRRSRAHLRTWTP